MAVEPQKKELIYTGKAKSLYRTDDNAYVITEFRDDTTAFNGVKHEKLASKGVVNNHINTFIMQQLQQAGVPTHFVKQLSATDSLNKRLSMIKLESVVRNVTAGSLCKRLGINPGMELNPALQEFFLKDDELGDPLVTENQILCFSWATRSQIDTIKKLTFKINDVLKALFDNGGLMLVDAKFEFGVDADGAVCLGDEISPDSCRIWDKVTHEPLDKDRFRQDLGKVVDSYKEIAKRLGVRLA